MGAKLTRLRERRARHMLRSAATTKEMTPSNGGDGQASALSVCTVSVGDESVVALVEGTDESYTLTVGTDGSCALGSATAFGALRGLESLSDLAGEACSIENTPVAIDDSPRFSYRGLMVDSSRHFLPVATLKKVLDTMASLKFNVLHWHLSDSESFPSASTTFPLLNEKGAYLYPDASYGVGDLQDVVSYAMDRGVRVMPEWDVPGHGSWGFGYPEVMITDGPCSDTMDPTKQGTYDFLRSFLAEMGGYFPDPFVFLGGDEVNAECFTGSPSVTQWMEDNGVADGVALQAYFWQQVTAQVLPNLNKTLGVWIADDGIPDPRDLPENSFGDVWQSQAEVAPVLSRGGRVVLSGPWYLDVQQPGGYTTYALQDLWKGMYAVDPLQGLNASQASQVMGGQACMWGEGVNAADLDAYAVTKAAAVAERLWSDPALTSSAEEAAPRLEEHVCRLNMRGVGAEAVTPGFCLSDLIAA